METQIQSPIYQISKNDNMNLVPLYKQRLVKCLFSFISCMANPGTPVLSGYCSDLQDCELGMNLFQFAQLVSPLILRHVWFFNSFFRELITMTFFINPVVGLLVSD